MIDIQMQALQGFYSPKDTLCSELYHQGLCDIYTPPVTQPCNQTRLVYKLYQKNHQ